LSETTATRIVVIGYGPVGSRLVEELLPAARDGLVSVTVVGAEREDAYNRVLLAEYAVGRADRERLELSDRLEAETAGVVFRLGETVTRINRIRQDLTLSSDATVPYDRLVLATGARANIPTLDGLLPYRAMAPEILDVGAARLPHGIEVLRDLRDADVTREALAAKARVVVLGAGVLGMELALAAREQGAEVVVVYHGDTPMERNLDHGGGRMLARAAERAGVQMLKHSRAESVLLHTRDDGRQVFSGLVCADGKQVGGDLLVLSCGVTARAELASQAGLATARGILVDEELRSWTDPDIFAIGDCAHVAPRGESDAAVPGGPSGLIGPGWRQADWLAQVLTAEAAGARRPELLAAESSGVVMLKSEGVNVVAAGEIAGDPWDSGDHEIAQWSDPARGRYLKTVARDGVLEGFVCAGMPRLAAELTLLYQRGSSLPGDPADLLHLDGIAAVAEQAGGGADETVCWCNGVSAGAISECVSHGADSVAAVGAKTRAGTGCGGCRGRIAQLLAAASPPAAVGA
jgi:assimilatory nitrate reductase electron transfer subunit